MKATLSVAAAAVTVLVVAGPLRAQDAKAEKTIIANERAVNGAFAKGDQAAFKEHVSPDGWSIDPMGSRSSVADLLKDWDKMVKGLKISSWDITDTHTIWVNPTTAVLTYKWTGKGTYEGQPVPSPLWCSTVWANKGGKWMAVFHQETPGMAMPEKK
jgi:ketosteroid isomerase-like protein